MLVQHFDQNLSDVFVVRVKVKDVPHHVGQTLVGEFLSGSVKEEVVTGRPMWIVKWLQNVALLEKTMAK